VLGKPHKSSIQFSSQLETSRGYTPKKDCDILDILKKRDVPSVTLEDDNRELPVRPRQSRLAGWLSWRLNARMGKRLSKVGSVISGGFQTLYFSGQWRPSIHEILLECGNFLWRIRRLRETSAGLLGTFGPTWASLPNGHLLRCDATRARMMDTQEMRTNHPRATVIDVDLFLEGWLAGAKWAADTFRSPCHIEHMGNSAMENSSSENVIQQIEALQSELS
jgi:hypothetical protein